MNTRRFLNTATVILSAFTLCASARAASGLLDRWSGDGNANDSVGSYDGVATGVTYTTGYSNQAFAFDGTAQIDFGTNAAVFGTGDFTIGLWVKTTGPGPQEILSKRVECGGNLFDLQSLNNGLVSFDIGDTNGTTLNVTSLKRVDDGVFHHVAVMRSGVDLLIFIDGVISGKSTATDVIDLENLPLAYQTNNTPILDGDGNPVLDGDGNPTYTNDVDLVSQPASLIAGAGSCATNYVGSLDQIEIYGRALTAYEVYTMSHPGVGLAIIDQPLNQRTLAGRQVIFHVLAVGVDPITYQWRFNGYDIPGAVSNNLVMDAPQTFDSGTYSVLVSNPTGDITSQSATLIVTNLSTTTNGLIARWSAEGTANDSIGSHNGVVQNISYVAGVLGTAFQFHGNSSISCGNIFGNMGTNDFTLDFWMKTTFKGDSEAVMGQSPVCGWPDYWGLRFHTRDGGSSWLQCQLGDHYDLINPEYNAEQPSTTQSGLHLNDGVFHHICTVHHANGLSVYVDGKFIQTGYSETPTYLQDDSSFNMGINPCIGIDGTVAFNGAFDEVEVYNRALSDEEVYNNYSPNPALTFIRQPITASVIEGQAATLFVSAAGQQPITYQWLHNGTPIPNATDATLTLASAQLSDVGTYTVAVSNSISSLTSAGAMITVIPANTILPGLVNYWPADGSIEDIGRHDLTQGADVSYAAGVSGQAFHYNGDDQSNGGNSTTADFCTNDFTIHLWINNENDGTVMSKLGAFAMYCNGGNITMKFADDSGNSATISSPVNIGYGAFHQVDVIRQDTTNLLMYIDSVLVTNSVCALSNVHTIWAFGLCDEYGRNKRFGGLLDEIQIYYRALSAQEVSWLYNRFAVGPRVSTVTIQELTQPVGSSFTLSAPAVTTGLPVSYQWMLNGVPIPGATGSTLTVSNFDPSGAGVYAVTITDANGSVASLVARVSSQLPAGSYNGLFYYDGDVNDDTSGFITLNLTSSQSYSASIRQQGHQYSFTGKFSGNSSTVQVKRTGKAPATVTISAATGGEGKITGVVRDTTRNIPLVMQRAVYSAAKPTPQAGAYTLSLAGLSTPSAPNGHGYGNVKITPAGRITFTASLSDNTTVSQSVGVAKSGVWPVYAPAYRGHGSVLGWLSFNPTNVNACTGTLRWVKSRLAGGTNYSSGFATKIPVAGSTFTAAQSGLGIHLNNSSIVMDGAKIYSAVNDPIVGTNQNTIVFSQSSAGNGTLTVTAKNGQFKGQVYNPVTHANTSVKGVVLQNQGYAAGYFLSSGLSGRIVLQHN